MSADNGIYIAQFPVGDTFEYRVAVAQAIENCDWPTPGSETAQAYTWLYFHKAPVFLSERWARDHAFQLYDEIEKSDFPILEYGISTLKFNFEFPKLTEEEARKIIGWGE